MRENKCYHCGASFEADGLSTKCLKCDQAGHGSFSTGCDLCRQQFAEEDTPLNIHPRIKPPDLPNAA